jgi:hypothetical protein
MAPFLGYMQVLAPSYIADQPHRTLLEILTQVFLYRPHLNPLLYSGTMLTFFFPLFNALLSP